MALVPTALASSLESSWLVPEGNDHPSSPSQSGDKFAAAVSSWFGISEGVGLDLMRDSA